MALAANALTTVAAVRAEVSNVTAADEAKAERLINVVSEAIESYCRRKFAKLARTDRMAPPAGTTLFLDAIPLVSVASAALDGTSLSGFEIEDANIGSVYLSSGWGGEKYEQTIDGSVSIFTVPNSARRVLVVTYTGGYVLPKDDSAETPRTLPYELEQAAIDTFASLWRRRGFDLQSFDGANEAIGRGLGGIIPGPIIPTLKRYQRLV